MKDVQDVRTPEIIDIKWLDRIETRLTPTVDP